MTWNDLTVYQFQQLHDLPEPKDAVGEMDHTVHCIAICFGLTEKEVDTLDAKAFFGLRKKLSFLNKVPTWQPVKYVTINGTRYRFVYDVRRIKAARYMELQTFKADLVGNLHKFAASMVVKQERNWLRQWVDCPYDAAEHEQYSEDLLQAPITAVYGSALFFLQGLCRLDEEYSGLFGNDDESEWTVEDPDGTDDEPINRFMQRFGWQYNAEIVAELERITLDAATELPVLQFLNDLAYIKAKRADENERHQLLKSQITRK